MIDSRQIRAARVWLDWSQAELSSRAGVAQKTIADLERGRRHGHPRTLDALRRAFERAGIEFLFDARNRSNGLKAATCGDS